MENMRASVLYGVGDIRNEFVPIPKISDDEVLINVKYVGICGSDLPRSMISGLSGGAKYPIILGHEFSGEVVEVGKNVKNIIVGSRVAVAPLVPCGECVYCKKGEFGLCPDYKIIGTRVNGALAEYVKVPYEHVLVIPDNLDYKTAAGIEPSSIACHGVSKAEIKPGDSVVVLGCGPIGQFAVQWAKVFGATKVIAVDIFDEKLELAKKLGATHVVNSKETNAVEKIKKITGIGADAVIETAGSRFTQEQSLLMARKHGTIVFVGISHTELPLSANAAESILRGELTIKGSWNSYTQPYPGKAWTTTLEFMGKGDIVFEPMISHEIKLEEVGEYLSKMAKREINFNKVIVEI